MIRGTRKHFKYGQISRLYFSLYVRQVLSSRLLSNRRRSRRQTLSYCAIYNACITETSRIFAIHIRNTIDLRLTIQSTFCSSAITFSRRGWLYNYRKHPSSNHTRNFQLYSRLPFAYYFIVRYILYFEKTTCLQRKFYN